jgi:dihydroneopterin aldolase
MADRIVLEGIQFYGYHGVSAEEQAVGHRFAVDLEVECDLREAGRADDPDLTIDYGELAGQVVAIGRGPRLRLLEALAEAIAAEILEHARVERVRVRVCKLLPPIDGVVAAAAVEIERSR